MVRGIRRIHPLPGLKQAYAADKVELVQSLRKDANGNREESYDYLPIKKHQTRTPMVLGERWEVRFFGQGKMHRR